MKHNAVQPAGLACLGIECGATRTVALWTDSQKIVQQHLGSANLRLMDEARLFRHLREIAAELPAPDAIAIGMAGARTEQDRERIRRATAAAWPGVPCLATNDLETALMAAEGPQREGRRQRAEIEWTRVLVLSGTGSCCFGRTPTGQTAKIGGWGHILGDKGSGYEIGLRALKAVVYYHDRDGAWPALGQRILRTLQLNEPDDLIGWAQSAGKADLAALAVEVFDAASRRDKIASDILAGAADSLARDAAACARRLVKAGTPVQFVFAGSVLLKQPRFAGQVARRLREFWPGAIITPLKRESVWGAIELARRLVERRGSRVESSSVEPAPSPTGEAESLAALPTEQRHPRSMNLHRLSLAAAIKLMLSEDARTPAAILAEQKKIERVIRWIVRAFKRRGRLFYVGAGTSGRLGVLDASECPPTFRTPPDLVQAIIAGGQTALWQAIEGAEDDANAGARAVAFRGVTRKDVVIGIAASGRTPFVWGALGEARRLGARTVLLCFDPGLKVRHYERPDLIIAPRIGPEILTGSTRLKAGTATKLVLNLFTTLAMVRLGKVYSNLMVDVHPANRKLRARAVRIVQDLTRGDAVTARRALEQSGWVVKKAVARLSRRSAPGRPESGSDRS